MNFRPSSLFSASYRLENLDRLALRRAIEGHGVPVVVLGTLGWLAVLVAAHFATGGTADDLAYLVSTLLTGRAAAEAYALVLLPPAVAALQPLTRQIVAGIASRRAAGGTNVDIDFTLNGVETAQSSVAWDNVARLVETPAHLFLVSADGEAVILPRRAIRSDTDYENLVGFIRARTGLRTA